MQNYEPDVSQIIALYQQLEDDIIADMVRRMLKMGFVSESTAYQAEVLQAAGLLYDDIVQMITDRTDASVQQVKALFEDAGVQTVEIDNEVHEASGETPVDIRQDAGMKQVLEAGYQKTMKTMRNLVSTTASTTQTAFIHVCDRAYMQVSSGAFSYQEAVRTAVKNLADSGAYITYPTGHRDRIDVAVRRCVLTGVGQTSAAVAKKHAEQSGCHLMELTAHSGARPDHARWQGQLVSLNGDDVGKTIDGLHVFSLRDIAYGDGKGFKGWNCRHNWHPYYVGLSTPNYTKEQIDKLNEKNISYNGEKYTEYEISQMQRAGERNVRALKRRTMAAQEAVESAPDADTKTVMESEYTAVAAKLKAAEAQLKEFCRQTRRRNDTSRTQVLGFGRSEAQRAVQANKKDSLINWLTTTDNDGKIDIENFKKALSKGYVNTTIEKSQQQKHQRGKAWKNQVKQALKSGGKQTPKSRLFDTVDPQEIVDKYGGTGVYDCKKGNKCIDEYIVLPFEVGVTFDRKQGKYIKTRMVQIKYVKNGTHVFPIKERGKNYEVGNEKN